MRALRVPDGVVRFVTLCEAEVLSWFSEKANIPENPFKWCETQFRKSHSFDEGGRTKPLWFKIHSFTQKMKFWLILILRCYCFLQFSLEIVYIYFLVLLS